MGATSIDRPTIDVTEAAARLGISTEAVRKRLQRGRTAGFKASNGQWRVYADAVPSPADLAPRRAAGDGGLQRRIADLEEEVRRQRLEMARLHGLLEALARQLEGADLDARIDRKLKPAMTTLLHLVTMMKSRGR